MLIIDGELLAHLPGNAAGLRLIDGELYQVLSKPPGEAAGASVEPPAAVGTGAACAPSVAVGVGAAASTAQATASAPALWFQPESIQRRWRPCLPRPAPAQ